jgi:hypothetical protein
MSSLQAMQSGNEQYKETFAQQIPGEMEVVEEGTTFGQIDENDIQIEEGFTIDGKVESVFGRKAALCMVSVNWKHKEQALKYIISQTQKRFGSDSDLQHVVAASMTAVALSCQEKVIKVLNLTL